MNRRRFIGTSVGAAVAGAAAALRGAPARARRAPNLLVFLPDEQRTATLACYGAPKVHAPNLNRLASESTIFERTYVTHPVCTPSRSSLLTGLWPHQNGCTHNNLRLEAGHRCFPELLGRADYRTGYMGKWHLGDEVFPQHGFQEWISIEDLYQKQFGEGRDRAALSDYSKFLSSRGLKPDGPGGAFSRKFASNLPIELGKPRFLEQHARDFIARHKEEPFILFVSFLEPHMPYHGPLDAEHSPEEIDFEPSVAHAFGADLPLRYRLRQEQQQKEYGRTPEEFRVTKRKYHGLVTQIDRSIGGILQQLERSGVAENTIVVHTSDHGDMMGAHGLFEKEVMFEEAARVPYLVRLPGQRRAARVTQPVSHIDFVPTLLDLMGAPAAAADCAGRSRAPLLRGETMPPETVFMEWSPPGNPNKAGMKKPSALATRDELLQAVDESTRAAVSPDGWKLCLRDRDVSELYHLASDPYEMRNLIRDPAHDRMRGRLTDEIVAWQGRTNDKLVLPAGKK